MEDGLKKKENTESDKEEEEKQTEEQEVPAVALTDEAKMQNMIKFIEKELKTLERDNDTQLEPISNYVRHHVTLTIGPVTYVSIRILT